MKVCGGDESCLHYKVCNMAVCMKKDCKNYLLNYMTHSILNKDLIGTWTFIYGNELELENNIKKFIRITDKIEKVYMGNDHKLLEKYHKIKKIINKILKEREL